MSSIIDGIRTKPCVGCGYCCTESPCGFAIQAYGSAWTSPCPLLVDRDNRKWCNLVLDAKGQYREAIIADLAIGAGCSSSMFNSVRDAQIAKGRDD